MVIVFNKCFGKKLINFQIIYNLIVKFMISVLGMPSMLNYVTDLITVLLAFTIRKKYQIAFRKIHYRSALAIILALLLITLLTAVFNLVSPLLYLWAFRNVFRFFIFFAACVTLMDEEDIDRVFGILYKIHYLNIILCLYEFYVLGYKQDNLGGIFGVDSGCNGGLNLYFCILLTWGLSKYLAKKLSIFHVAVIVASTLILAAFAELKVYYVEFVLICAMVVFLSRPSLKTGMLIALGIAGIVVGLEMLKRVFPLHYAVLMNMGQFRDYFDSAGTGGYNISRMSAFSQLNNLFFHGNILRNLFGFGFGACEYSSFPLLTSRFYREYGHLNYRFYSHAQAFLETGYVGFVIYTIFFLDTARYAFFNRKHLEKVKYYASIVMVFSVICVVQLWYNNALRIEYAYMAYFVLAIVAVSMRNTKEKKE